MQKVKVNKGVEIPINNIMKQISYLTILLFAALSTQAVAQDVSIFPNGEKAPNVHHTGDVWLNHLSEADETFDYNVVLATFEPAAKLDLHIHPAGQQLLITKGAGYYQERGKPGQVVHKGDVGKCLPGIEHWHAAAPESDFAYLAITGNQPTKWLERVTEEEYREVNDHSKDNTNSMSTAKEIINLSKKKWLWMSERKVDSLANLFHEKAVFVHMGGNMTKDQELEVIESGGIHYKHAEIQETSVQFIGNTAILLNKIHLDAVVGGNEVTNSFTVTEVYVQESGSWKLGSMSFTKLLTP